MMLSFRRLFYILFNPIKWLNEPYYIVRDGKLYSALNGKLIQEYNGNDDKWHPNYESRARA